MTQALFLVTRSPARVSAVNGVRSVLVNQLSTATAAQCIASAVSASNLAYNDPVQASGVAPEALDYATQDAFDAKYFDTVVQIGDLAGGPLNGALKSYVLDPVAGLIAATAAV